jgi:predicted DCC family thiol-disulfide oxidoreductase YuxK
MESFVHPTLYYDSACPLCNKEIKLLKRLTNGKVLFDDIHALSNHSIPSKESLLKRLHCKIPEDCRFSEVSENSEAVDNSKEKWLIGLDATAYVWSHTKYGFLFKPLRLKPFNKISNYLYEKWADRRYEKRYACNECQI